MTGAAKIAYVKTLLNDSTISDDTVSVYLGLAESRVIEAEYPFGDGTEVMNIKYEKLQCELASRMIMRRGFEGQTESNENGVIRNWASEDDMDILKRVTPKVGVR